MAWCISFRAWRKSRSRTTRTLERASGTAMVLRIIMMVKATISSTMVSPFRFRRLVPKLIYLTSLYLTVTVIVGVPDAITCPCVLSTLRLGMEMVVEPLLNPWRLMVASTPDPLAPGVPGSRFRLMMAAPASFWMFLVKTGTWPSLAKKSPRPTSLSLTTLGSKRNCSGEEATSLPFSITRATVRRPWTLVTPCSGRKCTLALPTGTDGLSAGLAASAMGGAVAGGIPVVTGAVAGGPIYGAVAVAVALSAAAAAAARGASAGGSSLLGPAADASLGLRL